MIRIYSYKYEQNMYTVEGRCILSRYCSLLPKR